MLLLQCCAHSGHMTCCGVCITSGGTWPLRWIDLPGRMRRSKCRSASFATKKRKKEKIQQPFLTAVPATLTPSVCWVCLPLLLLVTHVAVSIRNKSLNGNATLVFVRFSLSEQISSLWIPSTLWGNAASVGCVFYSSILLRPAPRTWGSNNSLPIGRLTRPAMRQYCQRKGQSRSKSNKECF